MGEINNNGAALRIGKGEIRDHLQQLLNIVRSDMEKVEKRDMAVAEIKRVLFLLNNL